MGENSSVIWVDNPTALLSFTEEAKDETLLGLDLEFIREKTFYPQIALIQVSTRQKIALVDPLAFEGDELDPLLKILKNPNTLKILHAAYGDQECLYWAYQMIAEPIVDTAVVASLIGYGENIGLSKLILLLLKKKLPKSRARVHWLHRPLSQELLDYAAQDVAYLPELCDQLKHLADKKNRWEWALEESKVSTRNFEPDLFELAQRIFRGRDVKKTSLNRLVRALEWRDQLAKTKNLPRNWVADNETLMNVAKAFPIGLKDLRHFRGFSPRIKDSDAQELLQRLGQEFESKEILRESKTETENISEANDACLDLLKTFITYQAEKHRIAQKFLLPSSKMSVLWQQKKQSVEQWVRNGLVSERAAVLFGNDLKRFLDGEVAIKMGRDGIEVYDILKE